MGRKRYLVQPGHIISKNDGDIHFIGARELMRLHGVYPSECIVIEPGEGWPRGYGPLDTEAQRRAAGLELLTPDYHGNYPLTPPPTEEDERCGGGPEAWCEAVCPQG